MVVTRICFLVYLLVIQSYAQGEIPTTGGNVPSVDCTQYLNANDCHNEANYACTFKDNACINRVEAHVHMCYLIDTSDSISSTQFDTLKKSLSKFIATSIYDPWIAIVTYDSKINVIRDVKPMSVNQSPMDAINSITNSQTIKDSLTSDGVTKCLDLLSRARNVAAAYNEILVTVAGRGPTSLPSNCGVYLNETCSLCKQGTGTVHDRIWDHYIRVLNIMVGSDEINGNLASMNCLNTINPPKGLQIELSDSHLNDGSSQINFSSFNQLGLGPQKRRLFDRLNNVEKHDDGTFHLIA